MYDNPSFLHDIYKTPEAQRLVFISICQGFVNLQSDALIVQTPVKKTKTYKIDIISSVAKEIELPKTLSDEAIAFCQPAAWIIQHKKYYALKWYYTRYGIVYLYYRH